VRFQEINQKPLASIQWEYELHYRHQSHRHSKEHVMLSRFGLFTLAFLFVGNIARAESGVTLVISDGPSYDYGNQIVGSSTDKVFTVSNTSNKKATNMKAGSPTLGLPFSFKSGSYPGVANGCGSTLNAQSNCIIVIRFNPTSSGSFSSTVRVQWGTGGSTQTTTRPVSGSAYVPDTSAPSVVISSPANGATVAGAISIQGTASDNVAVAQIKLFVDGAEHSTAASSPYSFSLNTLALSNGSHLLRVDALDPSNNLGSQSVMVTVYNPKPGDRDLSFGNSGVVISNVTTSELFSLATQSDGKILAAGYAQLPVPGSTATRAAGIVTRYSPSGQPDLSYGVDGKVVVEPAAGITKVIVDQATGKATLFFIDGIARVDVNGNFDPSLSDDGILLLSDYSELNQVQSWNNSIPEGFVMDSQGGMIMTGTKGNYTYEPMVPVLIRFHPDGALDTTFGEAGFAKAFNAEGEFGDLALAADGSILVLGRVQWPGDYRVYRFTAGGILDTNFGSSGSSSIASWGRPMEMVLQPNGQAIVRSIYSLGGGNSAPSLGRLNSDGSIDSSFGNGGNIVLSLQNSSLQGGGLGLQADGRIILGGTERHLSGNTFAYSFWVSRLQSNGQLDLSFGNSGMTINSSGLNGSYDVVKDVHIQSDGNILTGGIGTTLSPSDYKTVLMRQLP
jgi:uncharacterized delta-60 repeat protein